MTKVTMEYLQANGRYRRAKAETVSEWPTFLINHSDKQAHTLIDSPVFADSARPRRFTDWESFVTAAPPPAIHYPDRMMAVCEDQNIWPMCNDMMPDIQDRQMQFKEFAQDAQQNAVASATRSAAGNSMMTAWSVASLMIFCLMSVFILLIALQSDLVQDALPDNLPIPGKGAPAAAIFSMMGLVLPWRKGRKEVVEKVQPKKYKDFETVRVWDETSNSVWSASVPLEVLASKLPVECRYTQELTVARYMAMAFCGGAVFLLGFLIVTALQMPLIWSFVLSGLLTPFGVLYGYVKGFGMFMLPPVWVVRRIYERIPVDPNDERKGYRFNYETLPVMVPEIHTQLTGMPLEMAVNERRASAEAVIRSASQELTNGGNGSVGVISRQNLAIAYTPRIWRAYTLYEMLQGRDIKARMRGPASKADKLQKISMAGMALGSVGLLIVALLLLGG